MSKRPFNPEVAPAHAPYLDPSVLRRQRDANWAFQNFIVALLASVIFVAAVGFVYLMLSFATLRHAHARDDGRYANEPLHAYNALVTEPNRFGSAVVWPYSDAEGATQIRCFLPGAGA